MDEIIQNLIMKPNKLIKKDQEKANRIKKNINSLDEPEFLKVLEKN